MFLNCLELRCSGKLKKELFFIAKDVWDRVGGHFDLSCFM